MEKIYIDAGGTKIIGYLINENGLTTKKIMHPGNINTDYQGAKVNIINLINSFPIGNECEIHIGAAGATGNPNLSELLKKELMEIWKNYEITVIGDLDMMCQLIKSDDFLFINCGTGTVAINKINNKSNLYLGWGKLVNDLGSGYDIGINFIKFLSACEDKDQGHFLYLKFLKEHNLNSIRDFIPIISANYKEISNVSSWVASQDKKTIELFILSRIEKLFNYLDFIKFNNLYLTGSIFEKNDDVKCFVQNYYSNKKIDFVNFETLLKNYYF